MVREYIVLSKCRPRSTAQSVWGNKPGNSAKTHEYSTTHQQKKKCKGQGVSSHAIAKKTQGINVTFWLHAPVQMKSPFFPS